MTLHFDGLAGVSVLIGTRPAWVKRPLPRGPVGLVL